MTNTRMIPIEMSLDTLDLIARAVIRVERRRIVEMLTVMAERASRETSHGKAQRSCLHRAIGFIVDGTHPDADCAVDPTDANAGKAVQRAEDRSALAVTVEGTRPPDTEDR